LPAKIAFDAANHATNLSTHLGESASLSHGLWDQATAASGISSLLGADAIHGLGAAHQSSLAITQIADQLSHLSSGTHGDFSALTAAPFVAPTGLADEHIALPQFDIAYLSEFAHQMHI
jgi:hypothetical protein